MEEVKVLLFEAAQRPSRQTREELKARGIAVTQVQDLSACLAAAEADRDQTVIVDLDAQRKGIEALQKIHSAFPEIVVIVMASVERLPVVDEALREGAWDFVIKQPDLSHLQEIPQAIARSEERKRLQAEVERYREKARRLQDEAEQRREEVERLRVETERYRDDAKRLRVEVERYRDEARRLQDEAEQRREEVERVRVEPERYQEEAKRLQAEVERHREVAKKLLEETERHREAVRWLKEENELYQEERKKLQEETERYRKQARPLLEGNPKAEVARDELLADISEDLKSPLIAMMGYLEVASTIGPERAEPNQLISLQRIEALATRLFDLVSNHIGALDIEAGKFEIHKSRLKIAQILELASQARKSEAKAKNVEVVLEMSDDLPLLSLDAVQMERAVGILIGNAIALSPPGGSVTVTSRLSGNEIAVSIKDSGAGISEEELPFLFDRRKKLRRPGTNLSTVGLFVARHIVTAHGGRIEVQGDPLEGTTLTILLPL